MRLADLQALEVRPTAVILASPANPTGTMVDANELDAIVRWCEANGVQFISDEIYHGITYNGAATTAWASGHECIVVNSFSNENPPSHVQQPVPNARKSIVVNSFSKYFSMTGWRLGWLLVPDELIDTVDKLAGNFTCASDPLPASRGASLRMLRRGDRNSTRWGSEPSPHKVACLPGDPVGTRGVRGRSR